MNLQDAIDWSKHQLSEKNDYVYIMVKPEILQALLDGLEEQQREIDKLQSDFKALKETDAEILQAYIKIVNENHTSRTEHAAMKSALEWYAPPIRYSSSWTNPDNPDYQFQQTPEVYGDAGKLARSVLYTISPKEEHS